MQGFSDAICGKDALVVAFRELVFEHLNPSILLCLSLLRLVERDADETGRAQLQKFLSEIHSRIPTLGLWSA